MLVLKVARDDRLALLSHAVDLLILRLLKLKNDILRHLKLALFLDKLLFFKLDLEDLIFDHLSLLFGKLNFLDLQFVLSLAKGALNHLSDVSLELLDSIKDLAHVFLLFDLGLKVGSFLLQRGLKCLKVLLVDLLHAFEVLLVERLHLGVLSFECLLEGASNLVLFLVEHL